MFHLESGLDERTPLGVGAGLRGRGWEVGVEEAGEAEIESSRDRMWKYYLVSRLVAGSDRKYSRVLPPVFRNVSPEIARDKELDDKSRQATSGSVYTSYLVICQGQ